MEMKKERTSSAKPRGKRKKEVKGRHSLAILIAAIATAIVAISVILFAVVGYSGEDQWIYIPQNATSASVKDSLKTHLGSSMGTRVYIIWSVLGGTPQRSCGAYLAKPGQSAFNISRRIKSGQQTPVSVRFNSVRTMDNLAKKITANLRCTPEEFLEACNRVLPDSGYTKAEFPAIFLPDSYEFYWSASPDNIVRRFLGYYRRFWAPERRALAARQGLTPVQVSTLASIVEEETAKKDERGKVARLYLNRLNKGMKLQADPTVKFATGDFSLRRINATHIAINSPYNTYKVNGLPPGPIRVAEGATIDDVLNAPRHDYIYMCAKEDFSGYHNFAKDYETHRNNARRYQAELNRRNIH